MEVKTELSTLPSPHFPISQRLVAATHYQLRSEQKHGGGQCLKETYTESCHRLCSAVNTDRPR